MIPTELKDIQPVDHTDLLPQFVKSSEQSKDGCPCFNCRASALALEHFAFLYRQLEAKYTPMESGEAQTPHSVDAYALGALLAVAGGLLIFFGRVAIVAIQKLYF